MIPEDTPKSECLLKLRMLHNSMKQTRKLNLNFPPEVINYLKGTVHIFVVFSKGGESKAVILTFLCTI